MAKVTPAPRASPPDLGGFVFRDKLFMTAIGPLTFLVWFKTSPLLGFSKNVLFAPGSHSGDVSVEHIPNLSRRHKPFWPWLSLLGMFGYRSPP